MRGWLPWPCGRRSGWCSTFGDLDVECICRVKTLSGLARPTATASVDVASFMKASSWLPSILHDTPGENLDLLDRAVAAGWCRFLLEGAVLEFHR